MAAEAGAGAGAGAGAKAYPGITLVHNDFSIYAYVFVYVVSFGA